MERFGGPERTLWFERSSGRVERFEAFTYSDGRHVRLVGTAFAREGVAFLSPVRVPIGEIPFTFTLRRRTIPSRVRVIKGDTVEVSKRTMRRYFCTFAAIAPADLEAVARWVDDLPEPSAATKGTAGQGVTLPHAVMAEILEMLVGLKRLAPPSPGTAPLIRVTAGALRELNGRTIRDVTVHSRVTIEHGTRAHDTTFRVVNNEHVELSS